jgi:hypothetical protein
MERFPVEAVKLAIQALFPGACLPNPGSQPGRLPEVSTRSLTVTEVRPSGSPKFSAE